MMASILLIGLPVLASLGVSLGMDLWLKKSRRFRQKIRETSFMGFAIFTVLIHAPALFVGSVIGLLLSVQINRFVFDYDVLDRALPAGIFKWYGFGPGMTPQFASYWTYVQVFCLTALMARLFLRLIKGRSDSGDYAGAQF